MDTYPKPPWRVPNWRAHVIATETEWIYGPVPKLRARGAMGTKLVRTAFGIPDLTGRSKLVLLCMGLHSLDKPRGDNPGRLYWGGWELLAREALGFTDYEKSPAGRRAVARAIKDLTNRDLIKVHSRDPGLRVVYEVLPDWPLLPDVLEGGHP